MEQPEPSLLSNQGSPRRRKAPINLDTALYLQSQASYVQELNNRIGTNKAALAAVSPVGQLCSASQHQQEFNPNYDRLQSADHCNIKSVRANGRPYYSNISVDYIDCISNSDLSLPAPPTMKGIPHCRKYLRFHRNRVEPTISEKAANSADERRTTLGQQQTGSSSSQDGQSATGIDDGRVVGSSFVSDERGHRNLNFASDGFVCTDLSSNTTSIIGEDEATKGPSSSVLYPISVSEVKKRTYFIGSLGQDSLLGHDELYRYFPNGKVSIFVCTWNQNRKRSPANLNDLMLPDQIVHVPDIYAIGIQEAFSSQTDYLREWEVELQTTLGPNHVLLHSCSLGVLHLAIFVRRDLIWFCSSPEESVYNSRSMPTNMIKTKGAVSIAFRFFGTSFMFTNCHFPAHENRLKDRIDEYQRIINSIDLPKNLKLLKPRYLSNDSTARFDCVFFMGDLNFRLEQRSFDETIHILEDIFQQKEPSFEILTQNDELLKVMESNQAFHGFDECQIKFPPTYKFLAQTNKYDRQTKRVPSYTDRILFRSKRQRHIQCLIYDWMPQLISSDHKPVYCLFEVLVRPGQEKNMVSSLNAGLFQRAIYLEALKRRAEDPDSMRENGPGGSLICSIT